VDEVVFDAAIVGYGPTGASLANLLAAQGLSVLVIEREAHMYQLPRAVHFDDETMRVFQAIGIADALSTKVCVNPGMRFIDDNDNLLLDWPRDQQITSHGWNASYRLHQPDLETLLRQQLEKNQNATIKQHTELLNITETEDQLKLTCTDHTHKCTTTYSARYTIGCDGTNSLIRNLISQGHRDGEKDEIEDLGFNEKWLVVDVVLKQPKPALGDHSIQYCNSERSMTYCRSPGLRRRWELAIHDHEQDEEISSVTRVWELLSRWLTPQEAELERRAIYTFRSALANNWHRDRLLIAGDAAHQTPPFMGQGMCTGIRDAANLGWKLASVIQDSKNEFLLNTYQDERKPHAREYVETAIRLGRLINSVDRSSAQQMAKDQTGNKATIASIQPALGSSKILNQSSDNNPDHNRPENKSGRPFCQPYFTAKQIRFDDLAGYRHVIISREKIIPPASAINLSAEEFSELDSALNNLDTNAVWVRPDRYIGATGNSSHEVVQAFNNAMNGPEPDQ